MFEVSGHALWWLCFSMDPICFRVYTICQNLHYLSYNHQIANNLSGCNVKNGRSQTFEKYGVELKCMNI